KRTLRAGRANHSSIHDGGWKSRQSCAHQLARPCLFSARTNLRQSGGRNLLRDSDFGRWTANQARELSSVACAFTRRMAKTIVDCTARGERTAKVQVSRYASLSTDKI